MSSHWEATQKAIFDHLVADTEVHAFVADRIYDGVPEEAEAPYICFGGSDVTKDGGDGGDGRIETLVLEVWSEDQSRLRIAKKIADAVDASLDGADLPLQVGHLASCDVTNMQVRPSPDGVTAQALIFLRLNIDEAG